MWEQTLFIAQTNLQKIPIPGLIQCRVDRKHRQHDSAAAREQKLACTHHQVITRLLFVNRKKIALYYCLQMDTQPIDENSISLHPSQARCVVPSLHTGRYIANKKCLGRVDVAPSVDTGRNIETGNALTVISLYYCLQWTHKPWMKLAYHYIQVGQDVSLQVCTWVDTLQTRNPWAVWALLQV
jgi:hypothetical protein